SSVSLGTLTLGGLTVAMAVGLVLFAISMVAFLLFCVARFPDAMKLGFLAGIYGAVVIGAMYLPDHTIGVRPELHVSVAWFAGLIALEDARLRGWDVRRLWIGVVLIWYVAAVRNYAVLAPAGFGVYALLMWRMLPAREAMRRIGLCAAAACVVMIPFVVLYLYPNLGMVRANMEWGTTHSALISAKLAAYFQVYDSPFLSLYRQHLSM